jgi:ZIP family zinc transporter
MMTLGTLLGLIFVTGGSTLLGSVPVIFHRYLREAQWNWWESFGGGVMLSAAIFSLFLPAIEILQQTGLGPGAFIQGVAAGVAFILLANLVIGRIVANLRHRRAFIFVFVMGLHNIPEGLSVGVNVGALGWERAMHLSISIFIQNLPEGFVSSMSFLIAGFSVPSAIAANAVTAVIEALAAVLGFQFAAGSGLALPFLLSFAGAAMSGVVIGEAIKRVRGPEKDAFSPQGFFTGLVLCAALDLVL